MDLQLAGKTALVSGASTAGIGRAIAVGLAREGVTVAITARRGELLGNVAQEIAAMGCPKPIVLPADLYDPQSAARLAGRARERLGHIDILVNAAGGSRPIPLYAPPAKWEEAMVLNFFRVRELTHEVLPDMVERNWGRIINITGTSEPGEINAAVPAKAAVHAWAKALSREVAKHGITVNSIPPGRIMSEQTARNYPSDESRREFAQREIPLGRIGEPEELAALAIFLCSPLAGYITGTVITVDGGRKRFAF